MGRIPPRLFRGLKRALWAATDALFDAGLGDRLHRNRAGRRVVIYHGVDLRGCLEYNTRFISCDTLDQHLEYFSRHFEVVPLSELFASREHPQRLTVALTFDDGYHNNLERALPLLEKHRLPATIFVTGELAKGCPVLWSDLIDLATTAVDGTVEIDGQKWRRGRRGELVSASRGDSLKQRCKTSSLDFINRVREALMPAFDGLDLEGLHDYWRPLDREGIRRLASSELVTIGAHGHHHTSLGELEFDDAVAELRKSKTALEELIDDDVEDLAYPDGSYSRALVDAADGLGYHRQLAVEFCHPEDHHDPRLRERFGINPFMTWNNQLWCLLRGRY